MVVIFINCKKQPFIDRIIRFEKEYETRNRNTLGRFIGERVLLAETGHGSPIIRCSAVIRTVVYVRDEKIYRQFFPHLGIDSRSGYDWQPDTKVKYLYGLSDVRSVSPFPLPASCRRHGRIWAEYEGSV